MSKIPLQSFDSNPFTPPELPLLRASPEAALRAELQPLDRPVPPSDQFETRCQPSGQSALSPEDNEKLQKVIGMLKEIIDILKSILKRARRSGSGKDHEMEEMMRNLQEAIGRLSPPAHPRPLAA